MSGGIAPSAMKPRASRPGDSSSKSQPTLRCSSATYELIRTDEAAMGFESGPPRTMIPYSVSMPQTFRIATDGPYPCDLGLQR
jgi:hypothetical protein